MPNDKLQPGQVNTIPNSNYDVNKDLGRVIDRTGVVDAPSAPNLLFNNRVPYTIDGESKVNPLYGNYVNVLRNSPSNPLTEAFYTPLKKTERYTDNELGGYNPFDTSLENWYGENQSWMNQWGNRIGKFAIKGLGSFTNSLMDIPNTVNAVSEGNIDKMWDNPTNTWASDMIEWSEKNLPNYETNWEREHPFLNLIPIYGNSGNGWGKVFENIGFTVGAIGGAVVEDLAVGALTGGVGEIPLAAAQINKAVYKLGKLINSGDKGLDALKSSIKSADDIVKGLKGIDRFNYGVRQGLWGSNMITSGFSEAAFEGIESYKTLTKDLNQEFFEQNGRLPSYEESQRIDNTARSAANARFILNSALLAVTNSIQWGGILRPFNATKDLIEAEAKSGIKIALEEGSKDVFKAVSPSTKLAKAANFAKNNVFTKTLTGSASEGFEEGAQFAIQSGVEDFYKRKYDSNSIDFTNSFIKSFGTGLSKTLGSQEGWENIVYGLLGGALYKGGEHAYYKARGIEQPNYKKQLDSVIAGLNSQSLTGIFENKYQESVVASSIEEDMIRAIKQDNLFEYKNYKHEQFVNFILSGIKQNKFETRIEQLQELNKLNEQEFQKTFGIPFTNENKKTVSSYVSALEESANYMADISKRINRTFINPFTYKGTGNYKNIEEKEKQDKINEQYIAYEGVKEQLIYDMSVSNNSAKRTASIKQNLSHLGGIGFPVNDSILIESEEGLKELKKNYKQKQKMLDSLISIDLTPEKADDLKKELNEIKLKYSKKDNVDESLYEKSLFITNQLNDSKENLKKNATDLIKKVALINLILDEKDAEAKSKAHLNFIHNFYKEIGETKANFYRNVVGDNTVTLDQLMHPAMINELRTNAMDVIRLQKRNESAINNYASLTTEGGFKKLFDDILEIRKQVAEKQVNLDSEEPKDTTNTQPLVKTPAKATTEKELQGGIEDLPLETLTDEQVKELNEILLKTVKGEYKASENELEFLGFKTIDDLKFDNPDLDITEYVKVKSKEGKNFYIGREAVEKAKEYVESFSKKDKPVEVIPQLVKGTAPLRTDDFISKVFVPTDLKTVFNETILSNDLKTIKDKLSFSIKPLLPEFQKQYDEQKKKNLFTPVQGFPSVFVSKAPIDLSVEYNGVEIAKLSYPERLLFETSNKLVTIDKLSPEKYQELTGKPAAQHAADVSDYNAQVSFKNYLALLYKLNGNKVLTVPANKNSKIFNLVVTYGELDLVTKDSDRPLFSQLKRNTVKLKTNDGKEISTMAIVSIPKRYVSDTVSRERTEFMNVTYGQNFYNTQVDDTNVRNFLANSSESLLKVDSRYVGIVEKPDGTYSLVALRPAEMKPSAKEDLFTSLKDRALLSVKTNFVESTKEDSSGVLLLGDDEIYYKLPSDEAKKFNDKFNEEINNSVFISDVNGKSWFDLSVSPIGAIRLDIHEPVSKYRTTLYIAPQKLDGIKNFSDLVSSLNKEIQKKEKTDSKLAALKIKIASSNFRQNVANDKDVKNAEELSSQFTAATTPEVFKNGTMRIVPNVSELGKVYKKEKEKEGSKAKAEPENKVQATKEDKQVDSLDQVQKNLKDDLNAKPSGTIFGGINQIQLGNEGEFIPFDVDVATEGSSTDSSIIASNTRKVENQEDLTDVEFDTVKDALAVMDIGYNIYDGVVSYFSISTKEPITNLTQSPSDLAKEFKLKIKAPKKDDTGSFDFMSIINNQNEISYLTNIEKAKEYIYSILPSYIKVEEIDTVLNSLRDSGIQNPEESVFGAYAKNIIYLGKNAPVKGVEYHEAFHVVFSTMLSKEEQKSLLTKQMEELYQQKKKEGTSIRNFIAEQQKFGIWKNLSVSDAYEKAAEEFMAEKFRNWKLKKSDAGFLQKFFDLIERFFKWLIRNQNELEALFEKIDSGKFKYSNTSNSSFIQETTEELSNPEFKFMLVPARPGKMQVGKGEININRSLDAKRSKQVIQSVASYYIKYRNLPKYKDSSSDEILDAILDDLASFYSVTNPLYEDYSEKQLNDLATSDNSFIYVNEDSRDTIKKAAKDYINSINYIEQFEEDTLEEEEQDTGAPSTGYDNRAENNGGFSSLPGMLRQYISFTSYPVKNSLGEEYRLESGVPLIETVDSLSVYYGLLRSLANITDPVKFFQRMIRFTDNNEQSRRFVEKFIDDSGLDVDVLMNENRIEATKNRALVELIKKGFNKFRIDYIFTEHDIKKGGSKSYHANRKNVENVQFDKWANSFVSDYSEYGEWSQKDIRQQINDIRNKYFDQKRNNKYTPEQLDSVVTEVKRALKGVGIQVSRDFIKYSALALNAKKFDDLAESYTKEGVTLTFDDPSNLFITKQDYQYVQIMKIPEEISLTNSFLEELSKSLAANNNPFFREIRTSKEVDEDTNEVIEVEEELDTAMVTRILNVAKGNAYFDESVGESSYTNAENKIVYAHQDGTYNIKYSYKLRDTQYRKQLKETGVREEQSAAIDAYDKEWLTDNFLLNSSEFEAVADNLQFQRIDGIRAVETNKFGKLITKEFRDQKEGITYGKYSPREFIINLLNLYVSYSKNQKTPKGDVITSPHLIRVLEASKTADTVNLPIVVDLFKKEGATNKTKDILLKEVKKEFNRIQRVQGEIGKIKENVVENYHTGSFAEDGFTVAKGYRGLKLTDNVSSLLSGKTQSLIEAKARKGEVLSLEDENQIKQEIANSLNTMVDETINILIKEGVLRKNKDGRIDNVLLHADFFKGNAALNLDSVKSNNDVRSNLGHVIVNDYINSLSYNQVLHGDSALSLKNDGGIDAVKRAKGDNAAIISVRTDLTAPELGITETFTHSNIAIFKEPVAEDGTKIADAQMYATVKGLRYVLWGLGRLTPRLARVLDSMEKGENLHSIKDDNGDVFDAIFDESKGLLKWDEMTNSLKLVYKDGKSYFKMSVVVLQPQLTSYMGSKGQWFSRPGWETLHNLRVKMEEGGIHFSAPESASKMLTLDVSKAKDFSDLRGHLYDNTYFGLQTENPSNKKEITTPTQLLQLIDSEQDDDTIVYFDGTERKIKDVKAAYQSYVSQKVNNAYHVNKQEIYEINDFNEDVEKSIVEGKVTPRLAEFQKRAMEVLETSGADAQLLDFFSLNENGEPTYNLNMSATKTKFQQLYLAYFSKGVLSQKSPGYTVALMSGIDTKTVRRATRIVDGNVVEWEQVRRDAWDSNIDNVQSATILSSRSMATKEGDLYLDELQYNVPEYDKDGNITGYYSEMMLPAHYKEFLEIAPGENLPDAISKGFGVRIPSQDKHSLMSFRIIDFLPANLGSTGMFPKELITLSGADFDIDKEYISRYDFYTVKDNRGNITFKKYGDAQSTMEKWEEYKMWMIKNNKTVKSAVKEFLSNDADYKKLIKKEGYYGDESFDAVLDKKLKKAMASDIVDIYITKALAKLKLPSSYDEFEKVSAKKELNNGALSNKIIDAYTALLTNKAMQEIAKTPATLTVLQDIQNESDISLKDVNGKLIKSVFSKKTSYPVDTLIGKYYSFKNNTTGKSNIGINVNANLIYSVLNKGKISLNDSAKGFSFDNQKYRSFSGSNEFNLNTNDFDGRRTNDIYSTLISSATDEAKEQLNALYNLSVDALKVVDYLVSLKVPLKTAIYLVNQPSIHNYLELKGIKQNTIQTPAEEKLFKEDFKDEALARTQEDLKQLDSLSDESIITWGLASGFITKDC